MLDDPWSELVQSGCIDLLEAGNNRPLSVSILSRLRAKKEGRIVSPFIPHWEPKSLPKLCQTALLWALAGEKTEAGHLASFLLQFALDPLPLSLFCPEHEYNEKEGRNSFSLLFRALGDFERAAHYFSSTEDPFLLALAKENITIEAIRSETVPDFGLKLSQGPKMTAAFTLTGSGTSLGMIRAGNVEIRALGPQALPLSDSNRFGIRQKMGNTYGWVRTEAYPDVWIEVKTEMQEECKLNLRFVGLKSDSPLAFVFYVKADSCRIGSERLLPKSLRRFNGEAQSAVFEDRLKIESSTAHKVQVIPLAGEGCFWDSEFLIAFEIHPFEQTASFKVSV